MQFSVVGLGRGVCVIIRRVYTLSRKNMGCSSDEQRWYWWYAGVWRFGVSVFFTSLSEDVFLLHLSRLGREHADTTIDSPGRSFRVESGCCSHRLEVPLRIWQLQYNSVGGWRLAPDTQYISFRSSDLIHVLRNYRAQCTHRLLSLFATIEALQTSPFPSCIKFACPKGFSYLQNETFLHVTKHLTHKIISTDSTQNSEQREIPSQNPQIRALSAQRTQV